MNDLDNHILDKTSFSWLNLLGMSKNAKLEVGTATAAAHAVRLDQLSGTYYSSVVTGIIYGSTTLGTYTDSTCSITLPPGNYLVNYSAQATIEGASAGTALQYVRAHLLLTDNANNIMDGVIAGSAGGTNSADTAIPLSKSMILTVTTSTTYKTRFTAEANSGSPTITDFFLTGSSSCTILLNAVKIGI